MTKTKILTIAFLLSLCSTDLWPGVVPGRWEKMERVGHGTRLIILMKDGTRLDGHVSDIAPDTVSLAYGGTLLKMRQVDIRRVTAPAGEDDLKNGAIWGFAAGAVTGVVVTAAVWAPWAHNEGGSAIPIGVLTAGACGGVGLLVGLAADSLVHPHDEVLYEALP